MRVAPVLTVPPRAGEIQTRYVAPSLMSTLASHAPFAACRACHSVVNLYKTCDFAAKTLKIEGSVQAVASRPDARTNVISCYIMLIHQLRRCSRTPFIYRWQCMESVVSTRSNNAPVRSLRTKHSLRARNTEGNKPCIVLLVSMRFRSCGKQVLHYTSSHKVGRVQKGLIGYCDRR